MKTPNFSPSTGQGGVSILPSIPSGENGSPSLGAPENIVPSNPEGAGGSNSGGADSSAGNTPPSNPSTPEKQGVTYAVSKVDGLAVRQSASTSSKKLGSINAGDGVAFLGEENGFIKTVYKQQTAYVWAGYCKKITFDRADEGVEKVISVGTTLLGYPYVWGSQRYHWGNGVKNTDFVAGEFDCSALMQYVFYHGNGALLSLTSRTQSSQGKAVNRTQIQRGDLLFFTNASRKNNVGVERVGHVALYLGNNYILHTASDYAVIEEISALRWSYFICARRVSA